MRGQIREKHIENKNLTMVADICPTETGDVAQYAVGRYDENNVWLYTHFNNNTYAYILLIN